MEKNRDTNQQLTSCFSHTFRCCSFRNRNSHSFQLFFDLSHASIHVMYFCLNQKGKIALATIALVVLLDREATNFSTEEFSVLRARGAFLSTPSHLLPFLYRLPSCLLPGQSTHFQIYNETTYQPHNISHKMKAEQRFTV
jgi:hypothetical protein